MLCWKFTGESESEINSKIGWEQLAELPPWIWSLLFGTRCICCRELWRSMASHTTVASTRLDGFTTSTETSTKNSIQSRTTASWSVLTSLIHGGIVDNNDGDIALQRLSPTTASIEQILGTWGAPTNAPCIHHSNNPTRNCMQTTPFFSYLRINWHQSLVSIWRHCCLVKNMYKHVDKMSTIGHPQDYLSTDVVMKILKKITHFEFLQLVTALP